MPAIIGFCSVLRLFEDARLTRNLRPVLVFVRDESTQEWFVKSDGTGPALDVVVAEKDPDDGKLSLKDSCS
jgi:hypothetical protein